MTNTSPITLEVANVCDATRTITSMRSTAGLDHITIPWTLLGPDVPPTFEVCMRYGTATRIDSGSYVVGVSLSVRHVWRIKLASSPGKLLR